MIEEAHARQALALAVGSAEGFSLAVELRPPARILAPCLLAQGAAPVPGYGDRGCLELLGRARRPSGLLNAPRWPHHFAEFRLGGAAGGS